MQQDSILEDRVNQLEQSMNEITYLLKNELKELADIVRGGSDEAIADKIELIASIPCEHWPDCFAKSDDGCEAT